MKIALVFEEEFIGVYPSLINAVNLLSEDSHEIEIWSTERKSDFPNPPKFPSNVSFHKIQQCYNYDRNHFQEFQSSELSTTSPPISFWKSFFPESIKVF